MRVWTIQKPTAYAEIIKNGIYLTDPKMISKDYLKAYDWFKEQLESVVYKPEEASYPVWAWYKKNGLQKKPDFRIAGYAETGTELVCMELEIPNEEVLLSDYDDWIYVLNGWYIHDSAAEQNWETEQEMLDNLSEAKKEKATEISWEKIFDIRREYSIKSCRGVNIQAAFWCIKRSYLRNTWFFKAK
ncbi:MAG: DUF3841 domain-containing protein [Ruminococcus sp.]|nr:DUF3841 domain-containing protein [Ruminococcus sp.]